MRCETGRQPPWGNRVLHLANFPMLVEVHQVDRKLHEKRVDRFTRHDPQTGAGVQSCVLEQPDTALLTGVRDFHGFTKDGVAGLIPHQDFQFRRLSQGEGGLRRSGHEIQRRDAENAELSAEKTGERQGSTEEAEKCAREWPILSDSDKTWRDACVWNQVFSGVNLSDSDKFSGRFASCMVRGCSATRSTA